MLTILAVNELKSRKSNEYEVGDVEINKNTFLNFTSN